MTEPSKWAQGHLSESFLPQAKADAEHLGVSLTDFLLMLQDNRLEALQRMMEEGFKMQVIDAPKEPWEEE